MIAAVQVLQVILDQIQVLDHLQVLHQLHNRHLHKDHHQDHSFYKLNKRCLKIYKSKQKYRIVVVVEVLEVILDQLQVQVNHQHHHPIQDHFGLHYSDHKHQQIMPELLQLYQPQTQMQDHLYHQHLLLLLQLQVQSLLHQQQHHQDHLQPLTLKLNKQ